MALVVNGFEAGTTAGDGVGVTTGNSGYTGGNAFNLVSAGASNTITYSSANKMQGAFAGLFTQGGTAGSLLQLADASGSASFATRAYLNLLGAGFPATALSLGIQVRSTTDTRTATAYVDVAGKVRINGPGATGDIALGTIAAPTSGQLRLEFTGTNVGTTSSTLTAAIYAGDSTTPVDTVTASGVNTSAAGQTDRARFGKINAGTMTNFAFDSLAINVGSAALLGPAVVTASDYVRKSGGWVGYTPFVRRSGVWV